MNSKHVNKVEAVEVPEAISVKAEVVNKISHNNLFQIIGIVNDHYIV
jgi:hypothetical protein